MIRTYELGDGVHLTLTTYRDDKEHPPITLTGAAGVVFDMGQPGDDDINLKVTALSGGIAQDPKEIATLLTALADQLINLPAPTHHEE